MKNLVVARRYAKALLLIGEEDGKAETYRGELNKLADFVTKEEEFTRVISNPLYNVENRKKVLETVIKKTQLSEIMTTFVLLLFDKGRIGFLCSINEFYQKLADELKGVARASLVSATALSSKTIDKVRATLSKKTGKEIILEVKQDAKLIGGIVTRIGDLVLDGTVRTQLLTMKESLKRGESV